MWKKICFSLTKVIKSQVELTFLGHISKKILEEYTWIEGSWVNVMK